MATNVLNGPLPQQTAQGGVPRSSGPPRLSASIIRGAQQFTELFEKRTAVLRADYEERIRALTTQRDALLATSHGQASRGSMDVTDKSEIEALRAERLVFLCERVDRERERASWDRERAEWSEEQAIVQQERTRWTAERSEMEAERARWNQERGRNTTERAAFEVNVLRLTKERDTVLEERERSRQVCKDLGDELRRVRHELQVSKSGYGSLQEQLASRNASIMALETRVQQLEARTDPSSLSGIRTETGTPNAHADINADGTEDQQEVFNPLAFIHSPARSTTLPTISTQSTRLSFKSPSLDPALMQVRCASPPLLPFPFDAMFNLSPTFSNSLLPPQLHEAAPRSSTVTLQLDSAPSPTKSTAANNMHHNALITDFPAFVEESGGAQSATSVITTPPRRLVVRIPPSIEKPRKSLKPSPPRFTEEERQSIVHVPRQPESDDDNGGSNTASDAVQTIQDL